MLNYNGWWNKADINISSKPVVSCRRWSTSPLLASYSHLYRRFVNTLFSWESFWNTHPKTTGRFSSYIAKVRSWYNSGFFLFRELWGQTLCCIWLGCRPNSGRQSHASVTKQRQLGLLAKIVHIWRNTDTFWQSSIHWILITNIHYTSLYSYVLNKARETFLQTKSS